MRFGSSIGVPAMLALACVGGAGAAVPAPRALDGLQSWLDGTSDLECRFEQTLVSGSLGAGMSEAGRLWIKRPGKLRWDYRRPERKVAIVRDREAWLYLAEDRQLVRGGADWEESLLPRLLAGERRLEELFRVSTAPGSGDEGSDGVRLRLVPRAGEDGFEELTVTVEPPSFAIRAVEVRDEAGGRMRFRFRSLRRNVGVEDKRFELEVPPGTEVVDSP